MSSGVIPSTSVPAKSPITPGSSNGISVALNTLFTPSYLLSIASAFSYELMGQGKEKLLYHMKEYKRRAELNQLSKKDQDTLKDMKNVLEMYARGFDFLPIDIYKSKASKFQIVGDKLLPPFNTIDGMGDKAAEAMEIAAKDGPYLSKDDFRQRTKVSKTLVT